MKGTSYQEEMSKLLAVFSRRFANSVGNLTKGCFPPIHNMLQKAVTKRISLGIL